MTDPLYTFQADAAGRAASGEQVYLGFDPGLGKSRTALETAKRRGAKRVLVICPASGRYVWEAECRKWGAGAVVVINGMGDLAKVKADAIVIITYGLISKKNSPFVDAIAKGAKFDLTVLDEAAAVKNPGSNRTKAILGRMLPKLGYVLPMSGTPAPNNAGELYPILKALYPAAITSGSGVVMNQWQFEDQYCRVVSKRFGTGPSVRVIEGNRNTVELKARLAPFMIRVRKEEVLKELPPIRYDVVPLPILDGGASALPSIPSGLSDEDLLQYLSGRSGDEHVMRLRRVLGLLKAQPAAEYIDDFLTNLPGDKKLLVFAHHKEVISKLVEGLADWSPAVITGASTPAERTAAIDRFLGKTLRPTRLFIGNIAASGTGLTLVGPTCKCSDVVFVEATYSVGDNVQAACRVHRIGQHEAVVARFLTAHGTMDDRIQAILARKAKDFDQLFNA
jgi:SWI/SNF-related matrix-associated actin-dependent regulator 1 of chromatin subfamily A